MKDCYTWFLWCDKSRSPALNMAIDDVLLSDVADLKQPLLRFYDWDRPAVSIGYSQSYPENLSRNHFVVRRPTGGGIVWHDQDLTYTVVLPPDNAISQMNRMESYHVFHVVARSALSSLGLSVELVERASEIEDRKTMRCFVSPSRYDLLCDGRKIAGAAQRRSRKGVLHQGSIALNDFSLDRELVQNAMLEAFKSEFKLSFEEFQIGNSIEERALSLASELYSTEAWNINSEKAD